MKKSSIFSWLLLLSISSAHSLEISTYEKKIKTNYNVTSITEKITKNAIEKNLRDFLAVSRPSRFVGSLGHQKALEYLEVKLKSFNSPGTSFEKSEFSPDIVKAEEFYKETSHTESIAQIRLSSPSDDRRKDFTTSMLKTLDSVKRLKGYNLIWEKKGAIRPDEVMILGAHYDTLLTDPKTSVIDTQKTMPGADNNASGVIALLSMIEILNKLDLPKTIRIVFFDFDQLGFLGSKAYAEKLKTEKQEKEVIVGFINLVMLGNDSKREDKEKKLNNMKVVLRPSGTKGGEEDLKLMTLMTENGKRLYRGIEFTPQLSGMHSCSHFKFWEQGIPAICFGPNWESDFNPRFNTPNDFVETLNMTTYVNAFRYITGALLAWNYDIVK